MLEKILKMEKKQLYRMPKKNMTFVLISKQSGHRVDLKYFNTILEGKRSRSFKTYGNWMVSF